MARLSAMVLIGVALVCLCGPGILYNNFSNNGFIQANEPNLTCAGPFLPGAPVDVTCQGSVAVGCQAVANNCSLENTQSISFLSGTSPFTQLLQGNLLGLFRNVNTNTATNHGPFDPFNIQTFYQANCVIDNSLGTTLKVWVYRNCTSATSDNANNTKANSPTWVNWNTNLFNTGAAQSFYKLNSTFGAANWIAQINYTTSTKSTGYTYYGIDFLPAGGSCTTNTCTTTKDIYSFIVAIPLIENPLANGYACSGAHTCYHTTVWVALIPWDFAQCYASYAGTTANFASTQCRAFIDSFSTLVNSPGGTTQLGLGFFTPIIAFLIGLALLVISLGITIGGGGNVLSTGANFSVGSNNPQGSRLAQSIGLGLLIWSPLYSEFSGWFTSGILPYGLDGTTGIISLLLTGMIFFGIFWFTRAND